MVPASAGLLPAHNEGMKNFLHMPAKATDRITNQAMVEGLQKALEKNYARLLQAAGKEWDRRFAGKDPSDACVSVRISTWGQSLSAPARTALPAFISQAA